jgi:multicomponent Na+:H+ antiporter subunit G
MMDIVGAIFLILGATAVLAAAVGIVRMPDILCRMQASAKASTVGVLGLMLGAALTFGTTKALLWAILVVVFFSIKNPVGSHALGRACRITKVPLWKGDYTERKNEAAPPDLRRIDENTIDPLK